MNTFQLLTILILITAFFGGLLGYAAGWFWTGATQWSAIWWGMVLAEIVVLYQISDHSITAVTRKMGIRRRRVIRPKRNSNRTAGQHSFDATGTSPVSKVVAKAWRKRDREKVQDDEFRGTLVINDSYGVAVPRLVFATDAGVMDAKLYYRWLEAIERRQERFGFGRGLSENYWTRTYRRSGGVKDWWKASYFYIAYGILLDTEKQLPVLISELAANHPNLPVKRAPQLILWNGNLREMLLPAQDMFRCSVAVHFNDYHILFKSVDIGIYSGVKINYSS